MYIGKMLHVSTLIQEFCENYRVIVVYSIEIRLVKYIEDNRVLENKQKWSHIWFDLNHRQSQGRTNMCIYTTFGFTEIILVH